LRLLYTPSLQLRKEWLALDGVHTATIILQSCAWLSIKAVFPLQAIRMVDVLSK
jgi:hypothetical protein